MEGHAKEKVAGGKLISVKVIYDERIESVEIRGDFFIHPEESLSAIERCTEGRNISEDEASLASEIKNILLKNGIEMVGITPEAIARTLKKAIMSGTRWRVLPLAAYPAGMNMGIDNAILESVASGASPPTIRFYTWQKDSVSIGRFQGMDEEVSIERCNALGINCVRRITGGGAVYHDSKGELTYSIIAPEAYFPKGIRESYSDICEYVIRGLKSLGMEPHFVPINDILVNGKKISGNAQTRRNGVLLQHGTILYSTDVKKMFSVLRVSKEKMSDKLIKSAEERVTSVTKEKPGTSMAELYEAVLKGFTDGRDSVSGSLTTAEEARSIELAEKVYNNKEWNFSR